jgi:hypothetical protein
VTRKSDFTRHQQLGLVVFLVIGLATFVLGIIRIRKTIALPFVRRTDIVYKSDEQLEQERIAKLKGQDTDSDGLSDYDELYVFRTSPFLADSDSDGIPDGVEVQQGTDPNCPKGSTCRSPSLGSDQTQPTEPTGTGDSQTPPAPTPQGPNDATAQRELQAITETFGDPSTLTKEQVVAKLEAMSSADLRAFLVKMGLPQAALEKADDKTLRSALEESLGELVGSNGGGAIEPQVNANAAPSDANAPTK